MKRVFLLMMLYCLCSQGFTQTMLKGKVTNEKGEPLSGVTVAFENKTIKANSQTQTDANGAFVLNNVKVQPSFSISFSYIGCIPRN